MIDSDSNFLFGTAKLPLHFLVGSASDASPKIHRVLDLDIQPSDCSSGLSLGSLQLSIFNTGSFVLYSSQDDLKHLTSTHSHEGRHIKRRKVYSKPLTAQTMPITTMSLDDEKRKRLRVESLRERLIGQNVRGVGLN
jgi:hypothetical protein